MVNVFVNKCKHDENSLQSSKFMRNKTWSGLQIHTSLDFISSFK